MSRASASAANKGLRPNLVSVVITYGDSRRLGKYLDNWVAQTYAPDEYEIVAVINKGDRLVPELRSRLRPQDQLLLTETNTRWAMYAEGVAAARGDLFLLTEDHVVAETTCLEEGVRLLLESGLDGASLCWGHINLNETARFEELRIERDMGYWREPGMWNVVRLRGFAIWRSAFESVGGWEPKYEVFTEALLAAKLADDGYKIAIVGSTPMLKHVNTTSLREVGQSTLDYAKGCRLYATEHDLAFCEKYFAISQFVSPAISSPGVLRYRFAGWRAFARFYLPGSDDARLRAYEEYCTAKLEIGWRTPTANETFATDLEIGGLGRSEIAIETLHQLGPVEHFNGMVFRWSKPTVALHFRFERPGTYIVRVDTGGIRGHASSIQLVASFDARQIEAEAIQQNERFISVPIHVKSAGVGALTLVAEALPIDRSTGEMRELGIPVCALCVERIEPGDSTTMGANRVVSGLVGVGSAAEA